MEHMQGNMQLSFSQFAGLLLSRSPHLGLEELPEGVIRQQLFQVEGKDYPEPLGQEGTGLGETNKKLTLARRAGDEFCRPEAEESQMVDELAWAYMRTCISVCITVCEHIIIECKCVCVCEYMPSQGDR